METIATWDGEADENHVMFRIQAQTTNLRHDDFLLILYLSKWMVY